jgi:hypothetical protein
MTLPTNPDVMGRRGGGRLAKARTTGTHEAKMRALPEILYFDNGAPFANAAQASGDRTVQSSSRSPNAGPTEGLVRDRPHRLPVVQADDPERVDR